MNRTEIEVWLVFMADAPVNSRLPPRGGATIDNDCQKLVSVSRAVYWMEYVNTSDWLPGNVDEVDSQSSVGAV